MHKKVKNPSADISLDPLQDDYGAADAWARFERANASFF
jgi:hypothetical protein